MAEKKEGSRDITDEQIEEVAPEIAHDFNNVLVGILGNAQLLLDTHRLSSRGRALVEEISKNARRARHLSKKILALAEEKIPQRGPVGNGTDELLQIEQFDAEERPNADIVLVIDDEEVVRNVTSAILERAGYRAVSASGGEEGIELFNKYRNRVLCVLLDLTMPSMTGMQVFRELKRLSPSTQVLLMSGYSDQFVLQQASAEGIEGFIAKPFNASELLEELQQAGISAPRRRRKI